MPFRLQHKKRRASKRTLVLFISLLGLAILLSILYGISTPSGFAASFAAKSWQVRNTVLSGAIFLPSVLFSDKEDLIRENNKLKEELSGMETLSYKIRTLERENSSLRNLLRMKGDQRIVGASILSKPPFTQSDVLMIDAGSAEGISKGQLVVDSSGIVLGEVEFVNDSYSKVVLFSASKKVSESTLESGEQVALHGRGGGNFFFEVPQGFKIRKGELVFISEYPAAQVVEIAQSKNNPFVEVYLETLRNVQSITRVGVVIQQP